MFVCNAYIYSAYIYIYVFCNAKCGKNVLRNWLLFLKGRLSLKWSTEWPLFQNEPLVKDRFESTTFKVSTRFFSISEIIQGKHYYEEIYNLQNLLVYMYNGAQKSNPSFLESSLQAFRSHPFPNWFQINVFTIPEI